MSSATEIASRDAAVAAQTSDDSSDGGSLPRESWALLRELLGIQAPDLKSISGEFGLVPPLAIALQRLGSAQPLRMGQLGAMMDSDKSTVTWMADRLEERGLIERRSDRADRRVKLLVLTDAGQRVNRELEARMSEPPQALVELEAADQRTLRDLLRRALDARRASAVDGQDA